MLTQEPFDAVERRLPTLLACGKMSVGYGIEREPALDNR
jgi:hypothetical protein